MERTIDGPRLPPAQKEVRPRRQNKLVGLPLTSSPSLGLEPTSLDWIRAGKSTEGDISSRSLRPSPAGQCGCVTLGNHIPSLSPGCNLLGWLEDLMMVDLQGPSVVSVALQVGS